MPELATDVPAIAQRAAARLPRHLRGLLARELLAHGRHLQVYWALWLAFGIALPTFVHPGWILALGLAYALFAVPAIAGLDARDGCEEFAFALPATRSEIFRVRLLVALGTLAALIVLALGAMALGVSGLLWSLAADSGFAVPAPHASLTAYAFAALMPLALACCLVASAALGRGRGLLPHALAVALSVVITGMAMIAEVGVRDRVDGTIVAPALVALSVGALLVGHRRFLRKEALAHPDEARRSAPWIALVVIVALVLLVLAFLASCICAPVQSQQVDVQPLRPALDLTLAPPQRQLTQAAPAAGAEPHCSAPGKSAP